MCMTNENQEVGGFIMMMRIIKFKRILLVFCNKLPTSYLLLPTYLKPPTFAALKCFYTPMD